MRIRERLLICVIYLAPSLAAQTWPVNPARFKGAAQDSTGQVWAFGYEPSLGLYRWEGDKWVAAPIEGLPANAQPMTVATGSDGAVYCVWSAGLDAHFVTRQEGAASRILAQFPGTLADFPSIFVDSHGTVWITENGPHIYRVTTEGKAECAYTIPDEDYLANAPFNETPPMFNPLYATADAQGRIWFWSGGMMGRVTLKSLRGLLIFDGENFKYQRRIAGGSEERITVVEPDDTGHMWMAMAEDHLYRVDSETLTPALVSEPEGEAFRNVQKIFRAGQETFVVSGAGDFPVPEPRGEGRFNILWRLRNRTWERLVAGLDMSPQRPWDPTRPFLATPTGSWVGAYGTGPWFIPSRAQQPAHVDWHYNYPFDGSQAIFQLRDGRMLLLGVNRGSFAAKPADLLAAFQSPHGIRTLNPLRTFVQDQGGRRGRQGCESGGVKVLVPSIACIRTDSISGACGGNEARDART